MKPPGMMEKGKGGEVGGGLRSSSLICSHQVVQLIGEMEGEEKTPPHRAHRSSPPCKEGAPETKLKPQMRCWGEGTLHMLQRF